MKKITLVIAIATYLFMPESLNIKLSRDIAVPVTAAVAAFSLVSPRRW
jgi:hypothetical protein